MLLVLLLVLGFSSPVWAHGSNCGCSLGSSLGAGPIITIPAYTMPEGTFSVSIGTKYTNYGRLDASQIQRIASRKEGADDLAASLRNFLSLAYGLTDDWTLILSYPYSVNFGIRELEGSQLEGLGFSSGLGDLSLFTQYRFLEKPNFQAALLAGINFPIGSSDDRSSRSGEIFEPHFQPGSGAWNPSVGLALSRQYKSFNLDANFLYLFANDNSLGTNLGDSAVYNVALSYPLNHSHEEPFEHQHAEGDHDQHPLHFMEKILPQHVWGQHLAWDLILETNLRAEDAPSHDALAFDNHGGTTMFISPGLRLTLNNSWFYNLSVGFPVLEALDGDQSGTDIQLLFSMGTSL